MPSARILLQRPFPFSLTTFKCGKRFHGSTFPAFPGLRQPRNSVYAIMQLEGLGHTHTTEWNYLKKASFWSSACVSECWGFGDGLLSQARLKRSCDELDASSVQIDVAPEPLPNTVTWNIIIIIIIISWLLPVYQYTQHQNFSSHWYTYMFLWRFCFASWLSLNRLVFALLLQLRMVSV